MRRAIAIAVSVGASLVAASAGATSASSPANGEIAFVVSRPGAGNAIFVMQPNGRNVRPLATLRGAADPAWSPDGTRIAYASGTKIIVFDLEAHDAFTVTSVSDGVAWPTWSADATQVAFGVGDNSIAVAPAKRGSHPRYLVKYTGDLGDDPVLEPAWAPDGKTIAFVHSGGDRFGSIWTMTAAGLRAKRITHGGGDAAPSYSPDSKRILFERNVKCHRGRCTEAVWVMSADGSKAHQLRLDAAAPTWSPDGRRIIFMRNVHGAIGVFVMNADGSRPRQVLANAGPYPQGGVDPTRATWRRR